MSRFLTEGEFQPFRDALSRALGEQYYIERLSDDIGGNDPGFLLACRVTRGGNSFSVVTPLAVHIMDEESVNKWVRAAVKEIKKAFGLRPQWRN